MMSSTTPGSFDSSDPQADLVAAFAEGRVEGASAPVMRVETHLSEVFLAGDRVFKLKRAVHLPFVDFSTIERRHAACLAEVEVNRRLGSPFYLGIEPVVQLSEDRYRVGGTGNVVDWVVAMRRFDPDQQLDLMASRGELTPELAERIAERIAAMHAAAPVSKLAGHAADYRQVIRTLRRTEEQAARHHGLELGLPAPYDPLDAELARLDPLIEARRAAGKVRRCHGDLHLRNMCLFEGQPTPFDALEFDERMATTDVLYDLAFLLMDLLRMGLAAEANAAMNRYWDAAGENEEGLELLPLFISLRAAVRMVVAVEAGKLEEADSYRQIVFGALRRDAPVLVAVGGLSGVGKSAVARRLAPQLGRPVGARLLRSDVVRKQQLGLDPTQSADPAEYAPERRAGVYRELTMRAMRAWSSGVSVIADATFSVATTRDAIASLAGACFHGFWLDAPLAVRLARIGGRSGDASDADVAVAMRQQDPGDLGPRWRRLDARGSVGQIAAEAMKEMTRAGDAARPARSSAGPAEPAGS